MSVLGTLVSPEERHLHVSLSSPSGKVIEQDRQNGRRSLSRGSHSKQAAWAMMWLFSCTCDGSVPLWD